MPIHSLDGSKCQRPPPKTARFFAADIECGSRSHFANTPAITQRCLKSKISTRSVMCDVSGVSHDALFPAAGYVWGQFRKVSDARDVKARCADRSAKIVFMVHIPRDISDTHANSILVQLIAAVFY